MVVANCMLIGIHKKDDTTFCAATLPGQQRMCSRYVTVASYDLWIYLIHVCRNRFGPCSVCIESWKSGSQNLKIPIQCLVLVFTEIKSCTEELEACNRPHFGTPRIATVKCLVCTWQE